MIGREKPKLQTKEQLVEVGARKNYKEAKNIVIILIN